MRCARSSQLTVPSPPVAGLLKPPTRACNPGSRPPAARLVCSCGTHVLFPGAVEQRTCWKCGAKLTLSPRPREVFPLDDPSSQWASQQNAGSCSAGVSFAAAPAQRQLQQLQPLLAKRQLPEQHRQATAAEKLVRQGQEHHQQALSVSRWVWGILATSLSLNLAMILHSLVSNEPNDSQVAGLDSDGDGILDQHDFCRSKKGWMSGRATDFDADGCEDNAQDTDKDNDGVKDSVDKCPLTPQRYQFMSNLHSDADGDGCMDSVEDHDDDGDMVLNALDRCPRTPLQHASDNAGCSQLQLQEEAAAIPPEKHAAMPVTDAVEHPAGTTEPGLENRGISEIGGEWFGLVRNAWVEVLVGAAVTELCGQVTSMKRATSEALTVVGRHATLKKAALRVMIYTLFFVAIYAFRFNFQRLYVLPAPAGV